jgi:hypothetical protein
VQHLAPLPDGAARYPALSLRLGKIFLPRQEQERRTMRQRQAILLVLR